MDVLRNFEVQWVQGFTNSTFKFADKKTACYTCGNFIVFLNVETKARKTLQSPGSGIGAFTASGHRRCLAFSDLGLNPSIFIYKYPELELMSELKGTTKLGYTALALCDTGPYLVSASPMPDHTITLWNWESGLPLCSRSLLDEDISALVFNPMNWCQICAIKSKSLTIWNVERCDNYHLMKPSAVNLPGTDGLAIECEPNSSHLLNGKLTYLGPQMPTSAIAGLIGDQADNFVPLKLIKPRLCPSAICWSVSSDLYVGCKEGFLLCVNPETSHVSVLYKPQTEVTTDDNEMPMQEGSFQSLVLQDSKLFAAGMEGVLRSIQIKGNKLEVVQTWALEEAASAMCFSPDGETLLLTTNTGCVYRFKPLLKDKAVKVLDVLCGDFVTVAPVCTDRSICLSVREAGVVQLWALDDGLCMGSISLQTHVTSMACCPIAQYVVVGTATGDVLFVEMSTKQKLRVVHRVHLYHVPVDHLVFDQGGNCLITGASDSRVFVLDSRPSKGFDIIGWIEAPGAIVSLSTQYYQESKQIKVLVLCNKSEKEISEGNVLLLLTLFSQQLTDSTGCMDAYGCLRKEVFDSCVLELPHSLCSCVLAVNKIFGYCQQRKVLQRFSIPENGENPNIVIQLIPEKETRSHLLSPAFLQLSPHHTWLASVGRDGLLRICEISEMDRYVQLQCHSCWQGGVGSVCFTPDSQTIITSGLRDGSLVCSRVGGMVLFWAKLHARVHAGRHGQEWGAQQRVNVEEELKIANLVHSIQTEDEILTREKQLSFKLEKARIVKNQIGEELKKHKETVDEFREAYENAVAEDKILDKGFRKEFYDVPGHSIDQLYKLYKRRPRVQRMKTQTENNPFKEGAAPSDGLSVMMKTMEELDAPEHMLEGLDPAVWERFCLARRAKVESEQKVKLKALTLAEMQAFLQRRIDEDDEAQLVIKNLIDELNGLCDEKMRFRLDSMVQIVLQQGQVEVEAGDFIADYSNALLIQRKVVEDLNCTIRALGDQKITTMVECKDFRKGIIQQEWEHRRMRMQLEDLSNKARNIQTLRITQDIQDYLNETNNDNRVSKQLTTLERTLDLQKTAHQKKVEICKKQKRQLDRQAAQMQEKNAALDLRVAEMEITVAERRNIYEAAAMGDNQETESDKNYQDIILRKKLLAIARAQSEELLLLRAELEKLRMKNFPSLSQLHYN
ncbi:cilia- and flagella-associated protein 43 [Danio aesculapii]|uniref:cilia- and flagella-associated protein 43 n=1 Tax=Danio aesculapii TaxID=1142201 RepID=UPI0024BFBE2D|nr:cilia- and flagella-associated protein 43 [Danio aesculapii]